MSNITANERKTKTEKHLESLNVPVNKDLPALEEDHLIEIKSAKEIAERLLILTYLCVSAQNKENKEIIDFLKEEDLWNSVSENEKKLFAKSRYKKQELMEISWRAECIKVLLWAINKIDRLDFPNKQCNVSKMLELIPEYMAPLKEFVQNAKTRSKQEILDMTDLIYRIHWATRQAELEGKAIPAKVDPGVIEERHYAINWITNYGENWDEILTDT